MGLNRKSHSAPSKSSSGSFDTIIKRFGSVHIDIHSPARKKARKIRHARIQFLTQLTQDETKYMWDGPENAELWRLEKEEAEDMEEDCDLSETNKGNKGEPDNDNNGAGGAATEGTATGNAAGGI